MCLLLPAPVKKGTETVYSEVRKSKQGTTNILLSVQIPLTLRCERNKATHQHLKKKKRQETGSALTVNICIVSERMSH